MKKIIATTLLLFSSVNVYANEKIDYTKNSWILDNNYEMFKNNEEYKNMQKIIDDLLLKIRNNTNYNEGSRENPYPYSCCSSANLTIFQLGGSLIYPEFNEILDNTSTTFSVSIKTTSDRYKQDDYMDMWKNYFVSFVNMRILQAVVTDKLLNTEEEDNFLDSVLSKKAVNIFLTQGEQAKEDFIKKTIIERSNLIKEENSNSMKEEK